MKAIRRIKTQPTLLRRIARTEAGFACLLVLGLFGFWALAEMACTVAGVGAR
jgi:hypothetical protein